MPETPRLPEPGVQPEGRALLRAFGKKKLMFAMLEAKFAAAEPGEEREEQHRVGRGRVLHRDADADRRDEQRGGGEGRPQPPAEDRAPRTSRRSAASRRRGRGARRARRAGLVETGSPRPGAAPPPRSRPSRPRRRGTARRSGSRGCGARRRAPPRSRRPGPPGSRPAARGERRGAGGGAARGERTGALVMATPPGPAPAAGARPPPAAGATGTTRGKLTTCTSRVSGTSAISTKAFTAWTFTTVGSTAMRSTAGASRTQRGEPGGRGVQVPDRAPAQRVGDVHAGARPAASRSASTTQSRAPVTAPRRVRRTSRTARPITARAPRPRPVISSDVEPPRRPEQPAERAGEERRAQVRRQDRAGSRGATAPSPSTGRGPRGAARSGRRACRGARAARQIDPAHRQRDGEVGEHAEQERVEHHGTSARRGASASTAAGRSSKRTARRSSRYGFPGAARAAIMRSHRGEQAVAQQVVARGARPRHRQEGEHLRDVVAELVARPEPVGRVQLGQLREQRPALRPLPEELVADVRRAGGLEVEGVGVELLHGVEPGPSRGGRRRTRAARRPARPGRPARGSRSAAAARPASG